MPDTVITSGGEGGSAGTGPQGTAQAAIYDAPFDPVQHVPEPLRGEAYFQSFKGKTVADVIKSGLEAHKALGGAARIPGPDAKDEDWNAYYSKLRPEKVDGYGKPAWSDPKFGSQLEGPVLDAMIQGAYEAGLHPRQLQHILKVYESGLAGEVKTQEQAAATARAGMRDALRQEHKENFDQNAILSNRAARRFGGEQLVARIKELGLESDPAFFNTFLNIGKATHEDSWASGNQPNMLSRENAGSKVKEIMNDPSHPYHLASHPQHAAAVEQVNEYRRIQHSKREDEF